VAEPDYFDLEDSWPLWSGIRVVINEVMIPILLID
jgi:hypothetical protein